MVKNGSFIESAVELGLSASDFLNKNCSSELIIKQKIVVYFISIIIIFYEYIFGLVSQSNNG
jgi:hypothetical protein